MLKSVNLQRALVLDRARVEPIIIYTAIAAIQNITSNALGPYTLVPDVISLLSTTIRHFHTNSV